MGAVLRLWKLKGRLKLNSPLEEDLIGPADYGVWDTKKQGWRDSWELMAPSKQETRKRDNSRDDDKFGL